MEAPGCLNFCMFTPCIALDLFSAGGLDPFFFFFGLMRDQHCLKPYILLWLFHLRAALNPQVLHVIPPPTDVPVLSWLAVFMSCQLRARSHPYTGAF